MLARSSGAWLFIVSAWLWGAEMAKKKHRDKSGRFLPGHPWASKGGKAASLAKLKNLAKENPELAAQLLQEALQELEETEK